MEIATERRKLERFEFNIPAKIERMPLDHRETKEKQLDLLTSDISSGGAYFHTVQPLPEGTDVKIDLILPLDKLKLLKTDSDVQKILIKVKGTIVRSESRGMAIRFDRNYRIMPFKTDK